MSRTWPIAFLVAAFSVTVGNRTVTVPEPRSEQVCFAPKQNCTAFIVDQIAKARTEVLVLAYYLTNKAIVEAICAAKERGVPISIVLDRVNEQERYGLTTKLLGECANVLVDDKTKIQHNKVIVVDRAHVITGSFNFSEAARRNAENVTLIADQPATAEEFAAAFRERAAGARPLRTP
jgi:phosphatidylserine/phosphatidylglycerophosphate/cardiolipin synthase-like enzyme